MSREIERKFRLTYLPDRYLKRGRRITQGYLSFKPEVRIRIIGARSFLTVKSDGTLVRDEFEYRIPQDDAKNILKMCNKKIVKTRHKSRGFMIDVYHGALQGLIIAEYELASKHEQVFLPKAMVGFEVTADRRYKNRNLCRRQNVPPLPKRFRSR